MSFTLDKDEKDFYVIKHPSGDELRIAKKGLNPKIIEKIKGFDCGGTLKEYADGGVVKGYWDGGKILDDQSIWKNQFPEQAQPQSVTPSPATININVGQPNAPTTVGQQVAQAESGVVPQPALPAIPNPSEFKTPKRTNIDLGLMTREPGGAPPRGMMAMPDLMSEYAKAEKNFAKAERDNAGVEKRKFEDLARTQQSAEDQLKAFEANHQIELGRIDEDVDRVQREIETNQINPNRLWDDNSVFGKIGMLAAVVIGGYKQGRFGGNNPGLDVINKMIDRDMQAQELNLGKKKTLLESYMKKYGNKKDAQTAQRLNYLAVVDLELKKKLAQYGAAEAGPAAEAAIAKNQMEMLKLRNDLANSQAERGMVASGAQYSMPGLQTTGKTIPTKKGMEDITEAVTDYKSFLTELKEYRKLIKEHGATEYLNKEAAGKMSALWGKLSTKLKSKSMQNLGQITGADMGLLAAQLGENPAGFGILPKFLGGADGQKGWLNSTPKVQASLKELERSARRDIGNFLEIRGYKDVGALPEEEE